MDSNWANDVEVSCQTGRKVLLKFGYSTLRRYLNSQSLNPKSRGDATPTMVRVSSSCVYYRDELVVKVYIDFRMPSNE